MVLPSCAMFYISWVDKADSDKKPDSDLIESL